MDMPEDRLTALARTAAETFARKGYHSTTMRDLARETGMSLAGIYHYVESKDDLLYRIQRGCFEAVLDGAGTAVAEGKDGRDRLERFIVHHVTFFTAHMPEMKILSHEAESLSEERATGVLRLKRRYVDLLIALVREAAPHAVHLDPRVGAYALFGMMNWIYTWYDPAGPVPPDDLARQFCDLYLYGLVGADQPVPTS